MHHEAAFIIVVQHGRLHPSRKSCCLLGTTNKDASTHAVCIHGWLQGLRGALNAVLFRTGDQSRDFAVVLATNRPGDLDAAILDRMDESLEFGLPGLNERRNILSQYVDQYIVKAGTAEGGAGAASDTGLWRRFSVSPTLFVFLGCRLCAVLLYEDKYHGGAGFSFRNMTTRCAWQAHSNTVIAVMSTSTRILLVHAGCAEVCCPMP